MRKPILYDPQSLYLLYLDLDINQASNEFKLNRCSSHGACSCLGMVHVVNKVTKAEMSHWQLRTGDVQTRNTEGHRLQGWGQKGL